MKRMASEQFIDPMDLKSFWQHMPYFPAYFALSWAAFSGVFDKPVSAVTGTAKYLYGKRHLITDALEKGYSPLE